MAVDVLRELKYMAELAKAGGHPNIINMLDCLCFEGKISIIFPLCATSLEVSTLPFLTFGVCVVIEVGGYPDELVKVRWLKMDDVLYAQ